MGAGDVVATAKMQGMQAPSCPYYGWKSLWPLKWGFDGGLHNVVTGKVVHAETTTAHSVLNGMQYYHQDWCYAAAHVTVPPLRLDPSTPNYLMSLLGK